MLGKETPYEYEVAVSYARKDIEIVSRFRDELKFIFKDALFIDIDEAYKMTAAIKLSETLREIYGKKAKYIIIFYSANYIEGQFTTVEFNELLMRLKKEEDTVFFCINIGEMHMHDKIADRNYIAFNTSEDHHKQVVDIVKKIKESIINTNLCYCREQLSPCFDLNIQSNGKDDNAFRWLKDFDWNILLEKYIDVEDGQKLNSESTWQNIYNDLMENFNFIRRLIRENSASKIKTNIVLNCHLSLAYAIGKVYGDVMEVGRSNRNLSLRGGANYPSFDFLTTIDKTEELALPTYWCEEGNNKKSNNIIVVINIRRYNHGNVVNSAKSCLDYLDCEYESLHLFEYIGEIEKTTHILHFIEFIMEKMKENKINCPGEKIHLFASTITPLMFVLGGRSRYLGTVQLYEYLFSEKVFNPSIELK